MNNNENNLVPVNNNNIEIVDNIPYLQPIERNNYEADDYYNIENNNYNSYFDDHHYNSYNYNYIYPTYLFQNNRFYPLHSIPPQNIIYPNINNGIPNQIQCCPNNVQNANQTQGYQNNNLNNESSIKFDEKEVLNKAFDTIKNIITESETKNLPEFSLSVKQEANNQFSIQINKNN